ncbi:MAG: IS110 family transposase, partial [Chitinophagaceae bacterium]|nr:IS110 family transposase [Chitinophagaceae bacterium]
RGLEAALAATRATGLWPDGSLRQSVNQKCLMNPSPTEKKLKYVGLDVHAQTIAVAIAEATGEVRSYGNIPANTQAMDRLHKRLTQDGSQVRYVYEAGPTGFALCRHLRRQGIRCEVVSPSLIPKRASDRVKTDRRDALTLARLLRAGELTSIHVPDEADEAIRDLVRCRLGAVQDLRRCRQRIKSFLLRYGIRYSGKSCWSAAHLNYLSTVKFEFPAQQIAFEELLNAVKDPADRIQRLEAALKAQIPSWKRLPLVQAFQCFRGLALINAITWVAEIGDFTRFDHPSQLMAFIGITPSENSSGQRRQQGAITKTGNGACRRALIEAAWQYRLPARVTPIIRARHHGQPQAITAIAWKAQIRLCGRFRHLVASGKKRVVALTAIARELVGFLWAAARTVDGLPVPIRPEPPAKPPKSAKSTKSKPRTPITHPRATKEYVLKPAKPLAKTRP